MYVCVYSYIRAHTYSHREGEMEGLQAGKSQPGWSEVEMGQVKREGRNDV
jgi:hypothetical protein